MLDHDSLLPCCTVLTDGKQHEVTLTRQWEFALITVPVFARGYNDYDWFETLNRQRIQDYFHSRTGHR